MPFDDAEGAIVALADSGAVILGLDVRQIDADGGIHEMPWSDFRPDDGAGLAANVAAGRDAAIDALRRDGARQFGGWVPVTWEER